VPDAVFVVPGPLDLRTGGSIYNARMVSALQRRGWNIAVRELDGDFPAPSSIAVASAAAMFATLPTDCVVIVDNLAYSAMPDVAIAAAERLKLVPLVHMSLAEEAGISEPIALTRADDERRALGVARAVVVTGRAMIDRVAAYGIASDRITLVTPGTDRAPIASGSGESVLQLLCVAALTPGKGHDVLFRALAENRRRAWHLTCVGSSTRCPETAQRLRDLVVALGLADRVTFTGELEGPQLDAQFERADLFVLATRRETFGMAVAEAVARAIPIVSTATGEIPALVGEGGVVVDAADPSTFITALTRVLADSAVRTKLREGVKAARLRLTGWDDAAVTMAAVVERVAGRPAGAPSRSERR